MFTGVFGNCDAARPYLDTSVNLFDESIWIETVMNATVNIKNNMHNPDHPCEWYEREFLAILAFESYSKDYVSVLDFGGGPATNYASVVGKIPLNNQIYHIVDTPSNCELGRKLFLGDSRLYFIDANPDDDLDFQLPQSTYDIVMSSSTLQYSRNWKQLVERLTGCNPEFFVLLRLLTGPMPTFTTIQSVTMSYGPLKGSYAGDIHCTFINRDELRDHFDFLGYDIFLDIYGRSYAEELKQLPPPYNNGHLRTMIFKKSKYR